MFKHSTDIMGSNLKCDQLTSSQMLNIKDKEFVLNLVKDLLVTAQNVISGFAEIIQCNRESEKYQLEIVNPQNNTTVVLEYEKEYVALQNDQQAEKNFHEETDKQRSHLSQVEQDESSPKDIDVNFSSLGFDVVDQISNGGSTGFEYSSSQERQKEDLKGICNEDSLNVICSSVVNSNPNDDMKYFNFYNTRTKNSSIILEPVNNACNRKKYCLHLNNKAVAVPSEVQPRNEMKTPDEVEDCLSTCVNIRNKNALSFSIRTKEKQNNNDDVIDLCNFEVINQPTNEMNASVPQLPGSSKRDDYLENKIQELSADINNRFYCTDCGKISQIVSSRIGYDQHQKNILSKYNLCSFCGRHARIVQKLHKEEKCYTCIYCDRKFACLNTKLSHERLHRNGKIPDTECFNKTYNYSAKKRLIGNTSDTEMLYSCKHCSKSFTTIDSKQYHERLHNRDILLA